MSLCESIDTLAMAYLDDELAAEERHELEPHLTECAACRDAPRARTRRPQHDRARARGAACARHAARADRPRARRAGTRSRRRSSAGAGRQYLLPGSRDRRGRRGDRAVRRRASAERAEASRQRSRKQAIKQSNALAAARGPGREHRPWLRSTSRRVQPPQFVENRGELLGARLLPEWHQRPRRGGDDVPGPAARQGTVPARCVRRSTTSATTRCATARRCGSMTARCTCSSRATTAADCRRSCRTSRPTRRVHVHGARAVGQRADLASSAAQISSVRRRAAPRNCSQSLWRPSIRGGFVKP